MFTLNLDIPTVLAGITAVAALYCACAARRMSKSSGWRALAEEQTRIQNLRKLQATRLGPETTLSQAVRRPRG